MIGLYHDNEIPSIVSQIWASSASEGVGVESLVSFGGRWLAVLQGVSLVSNDGIPHLM